MDKIDSKTIMMFCAKHLEIAKVTELESNDVIIEPYDGFLELIPIVGDIYVSGGESDGCLAHCGLSHGALVYSESKRICRLKGARFECFPGNAEGEVDYWHASIGNVIGHGETKDEALRDALGQFLRLSVGKTGNNTLEIHDVLPVIQEYVSLPGNGVGGNLALVLSNKNAALKNVTFCLKQAVDDNDLPGALICLLLLRMSMTQRLKLSHIWKIK